MKKWNSEQGTGLSVPGAFKLDNVQPVKPMFQKIFQIVSLKWVLGISQGCKSCPNLRSKVPEIWKFQSLVTLNPVSDIQFGD